MSGGSGFLETRLGRWMDLAGCRGTVSSADEDIFFAPDLDELAGRRKAATRMAATRERQALAVCDRCPVQVECLAYAGMCTKVPGPTMRWSLPTTTFMRPTNGKMINSLG